MTAIVLRGGLAIALAISGVDAARAMTLVLVTADFGMASAVDRDTVRIRGHEAFADMVGITGAPEGTADVEAVGVWRMRFDCKTGRVELLGGFSRTLDGTKSKKVEARSPASPSSESPAGAALQYACFGRAPQPAVTFTGIDEFSAFYDATLERIAPSVAVRRNQRWHRR